jgi:hypothetical protein
VVQAGHETIIVNAMTKKSDKGNRREQKLQQIVELLKFVSTLNDEELLKSTIESVVELLEEEIGK